MVNYLKALIDLEFSVVRDYISCDAKEALSHLEVYKRVAIYNIYNRALNLFKNNKQKLDIIGNNEGFEYLEVIAHLTESSVRLFDFYYSKDDNSMNIGNISLFQIIENKDLREEELNRVMSKLERLYDEKCPFYSRPGIIGGPASIWYSNHDREIREYEEKFKLLDSKKELSDEDKRKIEITKQFYELLLEDYGLTSADFEEEKNNRYILNPPQKDVMQRTLVKRQPNLTIKNYINYI